MRSWAHVWQVHVWQVHVWQGKVQVATTAVIQVIIPASRPPAWLMPIPRSPPRAAQHKRCR